MNTLKTWLHAEHGRQVRLAAHLGIRPPAVSAWLAGRKPVPVVHGAAIEQFTGGAVTRQELFPSEWRRVWPELASLQPGAGYVEGSGQAPRMATGLSALRGVA